MIPIGILDVNSTFRGYQFYLKIHFWLLSQTHNLPLGHLASEIHKALDPVYHKRIMIITYCDHMPYIFAIVNRIAYMYVKVNRLACT